MTRSKPRMAMEMSFVRIRRWWVSQSQPPLMVSSSTPCASRSCRSMASTFTAPKSFSSTQTLTPCPAHHAAYLRRKVVFPAPRNPVIKSTCTIFRPSVGFFFRCQYKRTRPDCQTEEKALSRCGKGPFLPQCSDVTGIRRCRPRCGTSHRRPAGPFPPQCYGCTGSFRSPAHCAGH